MFSIIQLVSRGVGIRSRFDSKAWSPNHSAMQSPIFPEIKVNQVKRMVGRGYWEGKTACADHRGRRELEVCEGVKGGQGD